LFIRFIFPTLLSILGFEFPFSLAIETLFNELFLAKRYSPSSPFRLFVDSLNGTYEADGIQADWQESSSQAVSHKDGQEVGPQDQR